MRNKKLLFSIYAALFAAIVAVTTMIVKIPTAVGGYVNIGDGFVLLCGWILGPVWGTLAAGIGSMLADLIGYPVYAIATFIIKSLMALVAFLLAKAFKPIFKKHAWIAYVLSGIVAEILMVGGYFVFEAVFMSYGAGAVVGILPNASQAAVGIAVGALLMSLIDRAHLIDKLMRKRDYKK
ncbi:MAG: ECF transporter S component [Clostridia bacterium]|nr:ECF transporter S component [Clostridia bacterium]